MKVSKIETEGFEAILIEEEGKEPFMFHKVICPSAYKALEFYIEKDRIV